MTCKCTCLYLHTHVFISHIWRKVGPAHLAGVGVLWGSTAPIAGGGEAYPYCALYDIEADDWSKPFAALGESASGGNMFLSDALDLQNLQANIYEVFGDEVRRIK